MRKKQSRVQLFTTDRIVREMRDTLLYNTQEINEMFALII